MKVFLIYLLMFPVYLFSSGDGVVVDTQDSYTKGLDYYKTNDFKSSYECFSKIYLDKLSDTEFNFYFGRSAYETGHYETALAAFERVEIQDDTNLINRLEMARTYYMLKMYEDAEIAFREVLENPNIPESVRTNIELSLSRVSKVQEKSFTYATVMANILYDSNINYGSIGDYQFGELKQSPVKEISDVAHSIFANVTNVYDIGDKNGYAIKNSLSFYLKDYNTHNIYDLTYFGYNPSLIYKETKYTAEIVLGINMMELARDKFLTTYSVMPRLKYTHTPTLRSIIHLKYKKKKFAKETQFDMDANRLELSYGLQGILTPRSYIKGNILAITEKRVRGTNANVNFNEYKVNLTYANQFTSKYGIDIYAQLRDRKYKDHNDNFKSTREDVGGIGSVSFTMKLMPTLRLRLKTSYEYVNSNQDRFTYQKTIASAGLVKTF